MQKKMRRSRYLSFKLLLISALFYNTFFRISIGFGTLYISQITFIFFCIAHLSLLINKLTNTIKSIDDFTNIVLIGAIMGYGCLSLTYSYYPKGTINILITQFINILIFYVIICCLRYQKGLSNDILSFAPKLQIVLSVCALFEYLLSFVFRDYFIDDNTQGYLGGGRSAMFYGDANWFATFCFLLYLINYRFYALRKISKKKFKKVLISIVVIVFCTGSRIITLLFFIHWLLFFKKLDKYKSVILIVFSLSVLILLFPHLIFPYLPSFMQKGDLIDPNLNPRYCDAINLISVMERFGVERFGFGWGSIGGLNDYFPVQRDYGTTINVLPVQIYFDFGLVGCIVYSSLFLIFIFRCRNTYSLFIVVSMLVMCSFHMPGYQNGVWMLLGILYYIQNFINKEQSNNIEDGFRNGVCLTNIKIN